ncbi:MAG: cupredoxin domain-containing protein [Pseudomonadales bacterium]|nr:cupredoxin domain-containing protein [Pseudomonadales bacterium]
MKVGQLLSRATGIKPKYRCLLMKRMFLSLRWVLAMLVVSAPAHAQTPIFEIYIRQHLFVPAELTIPAGKKVKLMIINEDDTPEEFESFELNREKVIMGKSTGAVFIGPLKAGEYPYFGEFNPRTAQGKIIAE